MTWHGACIEFSQYYVNFSFASLMLICYGAFMGKLRISNGILAGLQTKRAIFVIEYVKDCAVRRAAEAAGFTPDFGYKLIKELPIIHAIGRVLDERLKNTGIDAEWLLYELADNHMIARQQGNIAASNTALRTIAQLAVVDALAKQRVELDVVSDKELTDRIRKGRERTLPTLATLSTDDDSQEPEEVSFI